MTRDELIDLYDKVVKAALKHPLKKFREERGLSLRECARLSGVDHAYIHRLEKGEKTDPSDVVVDNLTRGLKLSARHARLFRFLIGKAISKDEVLAINGEGRRDFIGADLRGADLSHNSTIIYACLGEYQMCLQQMSDGVRVISGCRYFETITEADEHWSEGNENEWTAQTADYGARQRRMLAFLADEARLRGWISQPTVHRAVSGVSWL